MKRHQRYATAILATLTCCLSTLPAKKTTAEETAGTVVLVTMSDCCVNAAYPEAEAALADELRLAGMPLIHLSGMATDELAQRRELAQAAVANGAVAAIRVFRAGKEGPADASLWISAPSTDQNVYRRIQIASASGRLDAMVVAVRTVETLRASLQEFQVKKNPPVPPVVDKATVSKKTASGPKFGFSLAGGIDLSPGGMGHRWVVGGAVLSEPVPGIDIQLSADGSPIGETLRKNNVLSTLTYAAFRGWIYYRFRARSLVQPAVGFGAGALWARAEGHAESGEPLRTADTVTAYLGGAARVTLFARERLSLFFDTRIGALLPEASVVHGSMTAVTFGHPLVELRLGLELRFFRRQQPNGTP